MEKITLELNVNQVNIILANLGKGVFNEVQEIVMLIHNQAKVQYEAQQAKMEVVK